MGPQGGLVCYDETLTLPLGGPDEISPDHSKRFSLLVVESSPFPPSLLHPVPSPPSLDLSAHPLPPPSPVSPAFAFRVPSLFVRRLRSASTGESCLNVQTKRWIKGTAAAAHAQRKNGRTTRRARERQRESKQKGERERQRDKKERGRVW